MSLSLDPQRLTKKIAKLMKPRNKTPCQRQHKKHRILLSLKFILRNPISLKASLSLLVFNFLSKPNVNPFLFICITQASTSIPLLLSLCCLVLPLSVIIVPNGASLLRYLLFVFRFTTCFLLSNSNPTSFRNDSPWCRRLHSKNEKHFLFWP